MSRILAPSLVALVVVTLGACASAPTEAPAHPAPYVADTDHAMPVTSALPAPRSPTPSPHVSTVPRPAPRPARPDGYVRLRGSPEIHLPGCTKVQRAAEGGVVPAQFGDGPPCIRCRRQEAIATCR